MCVIREAPLHPSNHGTASCGVAALALPGSGPKRSNQPLCFGEIFLMARFLHLQDFCGGVWTMEASGAPSAALPKSKSAEVGKRRDGLFVCPCSICSPKPIDPLAPRKSSNSDNSNCVFVEPPAGTLPPPPSAEQAAKEVSAGETVKVSVTSCCNGIAT
jgi:hypothetical protein